ncbi:hypothetical protein H0H81_002106 [Sphagnurus paluster]|uniref:F-box domain-containing protein n=1 Tax=Sphagnurus paluster TaxID=117069 RepID=A0A9P7FMC0_9AGAR|nr:hypothetical protein H0H81_002106 [Sphagnurus paluster]
MLLLLPPEILARVLLFLELPDLMRMHQVHSNLRQYIQSFHILQYHIATQSAFIEDNPNSSLPISERLELLKKREEGWARCNIDFRRVIRLEHQPGDDLDVLTDGIYLSGDEDGHNLHYVQLPSKPEDPIEWRTIDIQKPVVEVGLSVLEHDLLAALTSDQYVYEVQLLQLSTGKAHPRAQLATLFVRDKSEENMFQRVGIEIAGVNLVLIGARHESFDHELDRDYVYMFDWTSGELKLKFDVPASTYCNIIFLTPELVLLPNSDDFVLDIWAIPPRSSASMSLPTAPVSERENPPAPLVSLALPQLSPIYRVFNIYCSAKPNPTASSTPPAENTASYASKLFRTAPRDTLIICNMLVRAFPGPIIEQRCMLWTMFLRRADVLAAFTKVTGGQWTKDGWLQDGQWKTPDNTEFGSGSSGGDLYTSAVATVKVAYESWGVDITRWLGSMWHPSWVTTNAGTRCVYPLAHDFERLFVLDFNPYTVRRSKHENTVRDGGIVTGFPFAQPFSGKLAYTYTDIPWEEQEGSWEGDEDKWQDSFLLMDEEILLEVRNSNVFKHITARICGNDLHDAYHPQELIDVIARVAHQLAEDDELVRHVVFELCAGSDTRRPGGSTSLQRRS